MSIFKISSAISQHLASDFSHFSEEILYLEFKFLPHFLATRSRICISCRIDLVSGNEFIEHDSHFPPPFVYSWYLIFKIQMNRSCIWNSNSSAIVWLNILKFVYLVELILYLEINLSNMFLIFSVISLLLVSIFSKFFWIGLVSGIQIPPPFFCFTL